MTIAVRADVTGNVDMKVRAILDDGLRVLRHLAVELIVRVKRIVRDSRKCTGTDAAAAAFADSGVDVCFAGVKGNSI